MIKLKAGRPSKKDKAIASVQKSHGETIRMNVNIAKSLHRKIKQKALDEDTNVATIVREALEKHMKK